MKDINIMINELCEVLHYLEKEMDYDIKYDKHHVDMINTLKGAINNLKESDR